MYSARGFLRRLALPVAPVGVEGTLCTALDVRLLGRQATSVTPAVK